jgi:hypothetical protein
MVKIILQRKVVAGRRRRQLAHEAIREAQKAGLNEAQQIKAAVARLRSVEPRLLKSEATSVASRALEGLQTFDLPADGSVPRWVRALVDRARRRHDARIADLPVIDEQRVMELYRAQGGCCALSGIRFTADDDRPRALVSRPFAPSLDQIEAGGGYHPGNVRLICVAANFAMNAWGEDALRKLAAGMAARPNGADDISNAAAEPAESSRLDRVGPA